MQKRLFSLLVLCILQSCTVNGWGDDYKKLSTNHTSRITNLETFDHLKPRFIYKISGKQLQEELQKYPKAIVYIFTNGSKARTHALTEYQDLALKNNYKLFFVMDGFMKLQETIDDLNTYPDAFFAIDKEAYGNKNFKPHYVNHFERDLNVNEQGREYTCFNCLLYFEDGKFVKNIPEYSNLKSNKTNNKK